MHCADRLAKKNGVYPWHLGHARHRHEKGKNRESAGDADQPRKAPEAQEAVNREAGPFAPRKTKSWSDSCATAQALKVGPPSLDETSLRDDGPGSCQIGQAVALKNL
jgi:hypothetical protein